MVNIIVAAADNGAIGKDNRLLWHLRNDMRHFKATTMGHPVIMGRRTFDSMGRPLPGRRNIVISRQQREISGCETALSLHGAISMCHAADQIFIIGGGQIYLEAMPLAHRIYLTRVHCSPDADTFFHLPDTDEWETVDRTHFEADGQNDFAHTILRLDRRA